MTSRQTRGVSTRSKNSSFGRLGGSMDRQSGRSLYSLGRKGKSQKRPKSYVLHSPANGHFILFGGKKKKICRTDEMAVKIVMLLAIRREIRRKKVDCVLCGGMNHLRSGTRKSEREGGGEVIRSSGRRRNFLLGVNLNKQSVLN